jgi:prolyl-tRNA synthetase
MRTSRLFFATLREAPKEADTASHKLMLRASLIRQVAAGVYEWLPLGWRAVRKVAEIVREEMDRAGAQEVLLPQLMPREWWEESGRWKAYGKELMRIKDRHEREFALGPTHEEAVTDMARGVARTWRRLPVTLYQIQTKFRDEVRPRFGVMRAREFMMKDAYSFDVDDAASEKSYEAMRVAYNAVFTRLGLGYRMVDADSGSIGGAFSQEFMVLADSGEAVIATCSSCEYAASEDKAEPASPVPQAAEVPPMAPVATPATKSINMLSKFLNKPASELSKILFFQADGVLVGALIRGDHEINETKLAKALGATDVVMAKADAITAELGVPVGYIGPVGLKPVRVIVDRDLAASPSIVCGANKVDEHLVNVKPGRDFEIKETGQIRNIVEGDICPKCGGKLKLIRGIEVGHIFKLGLKYSSAMHAVFQDESGKEREMVMGCYGIGVTRIVAAAIEQGHDEKGIIWPESIAPYLVTVVSVGAEPEVTAAAEKLYSELLGAGVDVLFDDRDEAPGVKFADADLLGSPWQVIVGKAFKKEGKMEVRARRTKETFLVNPGDVVARFASS